MSSSKNTEPTDLLTLANEIVACSGEGVFGDAFAPREWADAAQWYLDTNGEDTDLQTLLDEQASWDAYAEYADRAQFRVTPLDYEDWLARAGESYLPGRNSL